MRAIHTLCIILFVNFNIYCISGKTASEPEPIQVLFIGSSYFYDNNLPDLFRKLVESSGRSAYIDNYNPCGLYLDHHASSSLTESKIRERHWDYVILQGVGAVTAYPEYFTEYPVYPALVTLRDKISGNCAETGMVFCLPWAFEDGMTWKEGWKDMYTDMQVKIYNNTLLYSDEIGFIVAPVGWAWFEVLADKQYPLHYLHDSDWNHPSLKGSYLMACVIYSTVFRESSTGIPFCSKLDLDEANYFQGIASSTVLENPSLWNIPDLISQAGYASVPGMQLHQNYPNPFKGETVIEYVIQEAGLVEISIYDVCGNKCLGLVNEFKMPGRYRLKIEDCPLSKGIYLYTLKSGTECHTREMVIFH